jgi:hypothetical protein
VLSKAEAGLSDCDEAIDIEYGRNVW